MITHQRLKQVVRYNDITGIFHWNMSGINKEKNEIAGTKKKYSSGKSYLRMCIDGKDYLAHRLAYFYYHGLHPGDEIDHIDGDGLNNKISNLRSVDKLENLKNKKRYNCNKSGFTGVHLRSCGKWRARIRVNTKMDNLGTFLKLSDAVKARVDAEVKHGFHINHGKDRPL